MNTPICDFARRYAEGGAVRLHMPGHKGKPFLGVEPLDITEIDGADSLYEAAGIIHQSEENASRLFGCKTLYSTEGSSQCIRAMLYLVALHARQNGLTPLIAAGRNAHKTFLSAAALLDIDVMWLYSKEAPSYLCCDISADELETALTAARPKPTAVYLTSPDYLGSVADIATLAQVCHRYGVLLLVDNAHGAYLKFLEPSQHPIDLGADLCCDSAHKTLPVLTGGAYLHISHTAPETFSKQAKNALALFGSTSPSYLILQSLDAANVYLTGHKQRLRDFSPSVERLKSRLTTHGYTMYGQELLKITIDAKKFGYTGHALAQLLTTQDIVCEFADPDYLVLMLTPELGTDDMARLEKALLAIPQNTPIADAPPPFRTGKRALSIREAMLSPAETVPIKESTGRILAAASVGCPPAVPILICGERIDSHAISSFEYYGIESCSVVCE